MSTLGLFWTALGLLGAGAPAPADIRCEASGRYSGALDRHYTLTISGPAEKTWCFASVVDPGGKRFDLSGTYELVEDLAIFTTRDQTVRFGINYGYPDGRVRFNGYFPASEQKLRFHRKWFQRVNGEWRPLEEVTLTIPRAAPAGKTWKLEVAGERLRWDKDGRLTRTQIAEVQTFERVALTAYQRRLPGPGEAVQMLYLIAKDGRLEAAWFGGNDGIAGDLRGFSPRLADPPRDP